MPSLKAIRRRIGSVRSTQKVTRAMKLVAAAKFARANQAVRAARPYSVAFQEMMGKLLGFLEQSVSEDELLLLAERPEQRVLLVILSPDRGLCGALNSNLFRATTRWLDEKAKNGVEVELWAWGGKAKQFIAKRPEKTGQAKAHVADKADYARAKACAGDIVDGFRAGQYDHVFIAYPEFKSALSQSIVVKQLLPVPKPAKKKAQDDMQRQYIVEPPLKEFIKRFLERAVSTFIFQTFLEANASEHGARMTAMEGATTNAGEVIKKLTLQYNRARQAAITKELIEIVSGAEAL